MKIAALYARVSSAKQQLNENIASQIAAIEQYAQQHDYHISPQHVYNDDGYSGARLDRPALDRLRDAVAQGEVETVLILSPDPLARHFPYQYIVVEEFERAGCETVFTNHNFDASPAEPMLQEMTGVLRWSRFFGQQCCLEYMRRDYEKGIISVVIFDDIENSAADAYVPTFIFEFPDNDS